MFMNPVCKQFPAKHGRHHRLLRHRGRNDGKDSAFQQLRQDHDAGK